MSVEGSWRLPITGDGTEHDYYQTTAEMGHLHYISLGNPAGLDAFQNSYPFENLHEPLKTFYWSGTEYPVLSEYYAWVFQFEYGIAGPGSKLGVGYGIAVLPADVQVVPIPGAVLLLSSGLIGLVGIRRKFKK